MNISTLLKFTCLARAQNPKAQVSFALTSTCGICRNHPRSCRSRDPSHSLALSSPHSCHIPHTGTSGHTRGRLNTAVVLFGFDFQGSPQATRSHRPVNLLLSPQHHAKHHEGARQNTDGFPQLQHRRSCSDTTVWE